MPIEIKLGPESVQVPAGEPFSLCLCARCAQRFKAPAGLPAAPGYLCPACSGRAGADTPHVVDGNG